MSALSTRRVWLALISLAIGGFGIGATEFVVMGLLPNIAAELLPDLDAVDHEAAIAQTGWLISAYALGVVVGAPTIAAIAGRFPRKRLLLVLLVAFTLGTLASAVLPSFGLVALARFVAALPHGAYFGIASLVAADLMGPGKRARGVALVLSGLTIANVIGVPLITFVGQNAGWRVAYLVVAGIFAFTFVCVAVFVPFQAGDRALTMMGQLRGLRNVQLWLTLAAGAAGFGGFFAVYSYVADVVVSVSSLDEGFVPFALASVGLGMTVGNLAGGRFADVSVRRTILIGFVFFFASLLGFALTAQNPIGLLVFLFFIGATSSAIVPALQSRLMDVSRGAQSLAAAMMHSSLNIGNGLGAALGGLTIAAGYGFLSPTWVGVILCVPGFLIAFIAFRFVPGPETTQFAVPSKATK